MSRNSLVVAIGIALIIPLVQGCTSTSPRTKIGFGEEAEVESYVRYGAVRTQNETFRWTDAFISEGEGENDGKHFVEVVGTYLRKDAATVERMLIGGEPSIAFEIVSAKVVNCMPILLKCHHVVHVRAPVSPEQLAVGARDGLAVLVTTNDPEIIYPLRLPKEYVLGLQGNASTPPTSCDTSQASC